MAADFHLVAFRFFALDTTWRLEDVQWAIVEEQKPVAVKRKTLEKALEDATDGGN